MVAMAVLVIAALAIWWLGRSSVTYESAVIGRGDIESSVSAVGKLQPRRYVDVGAQVSGQILRLHVQAGDAVKKGQLLAEIDPSVQKATVDAGRASLTGLRAQLAEQQAQHMLAGQQVQRQRQLDAGGATRSEDVDIAESNLTQAAARVEHLKAQITQTSATLQADEVRLGYTNIYATMDGTIVSVDAREGQTLNATYQTPNIMRIADLGRMTVWTEVSEAEVRKVRAGMPVYFTTLGADRRRWHGEVRQVLPAPPSPEGKSADTALAPSTSKVIVYTALFDVDNADGELMPQMTAQVSFVSAAARDVVVAPLAALKPIKSELAAPGAYTARVLDADGRIQERRVRAGVRNRVSAEVLEGLAEGERIVTGEQRHEGALKRFQL
ncbi:efflux RND transporter periplasmic adaptor subunit [Herbaspirillum sp. LeCh32-8]|uniref:efflux RND transporter periplasmic adaptor subunit n=1 Tax=Herbaspirillum sp. LeCh32-8 TaxID=2821356 RepID=UPI001AE2D8F5|nr:efflux RND transporter periplasmic adaptor subunit [Herbaspirillum sp. LeCh32-8]MBP0597154.1 efflux RND transporter periplasmic adaptor subunit [Herbaspirillum sp. LeCh32-8]